MSHANIYLRYSLYSYQSVGLCTGKRDPNFLTPTYGRSTGVTVRRGPFSIFGCLSAVLCPGAVLFHLDSFGASGAVAVVCMGGWRSCMGGWQ